MTLTQIGEAAAPFQTAYNELRKLVDTTSLGPDIAALLRDETPEAEVKTTWLGSATSQSPLTCPGTH